MPRSGENIHHRSDGRYEGRYIASRDEEGKARYKSVYADTRDGARVKLAEARAAVRQEQMVGVTTFKEAYHAWMEERRKQVTQATADRYEYLLEKFVLPLLGDRDIASITPAQTSVLAASLANVEERGEDAISASVAETLMGFMNSIISFSRDGAQFLPFGAIRNDEQTHFEPLSAGETRKLVSCAKMNRSPEMLGVLLALYAGVGTGELCALSWDDVDRGRREVYIHNTLYRVKDKGGGRKRTKLTVTEVRKSNIRTVTYPEALDSYVAEFYKKGTVFLTGEQGHYIEQRTLSNRLEKVFAVRGLSGLTLQRLNKTYKDGLADVRYLTDPYYRPEDSASTVLEINEKWLLKEMENDLSSLRGLLGLSGGELGGVLGMTEDEYLALEAGETALDWQGFLSLLFFFRYNAKTEGVVDALGLYPNALREKLSIHG